MDVKTPDRSTRTRQLETLLGIARDLTASLGAKDRYARLVAAVKQAIPCDAASLLRLDDDELVLVAAVGLAPRALTTRFARRDHPRLAAILAAGGEPVQFPPDSPLPDPFDGLLDADPHALDHVHACLGCALTDGGEVVGALAVDALDPTAFDGIDIELVATLGALAGAAMRTTALIEALEKRAEHRWRVAKELVAETGGAPLLGISAPARKLREEISLVAGSDLAVLVTGETGTGKELVARHLHAASRRHDEALIHLNCAALPESIAESELFGHVAGSFTGAVKDRAGKFEVADGGTLFLDEIGELPLSLQPKLLRALQQGEIQRVGSDRVHRVDVRVVAATNRDLPREVEEGRFRADLYHRLAVYPIRVPPLRERREDIPVLATHFLDTARRRLGVGRIVLTPAARERLTAADWPGNVRELENVLSRAVLRASWNRDERGGVTVDVPHLDVDAPAAAAPAPAAAELELPEVPPGTPLAELVDAFKRATIERALKKNGGSWAAAARDLGLHRANLHHLATRLGLRTHK